MARAKLRNGVMGAAGGKRKGAGRKPDWFKAKMLKIGTSHKAIAFLTAMVNGDPIEEKVLNEGSAEPIKVLVSASPDSRIRAWNSVMDRGLGKPSQPLEHSGEVGGRFIMICAEGA